VGAEKSSTHNRGLGDMRNEESEQNRYNRVEKKRVSVCNFGFGATYRREASVDSESARTPNTSPVTTCGKKGVWWVRGGG